MHPATISDDPTGLHPRVRAGVLGLVLWAAWPALAADAPLGFEDPALQARYQALLKELRCMVCQNQSLADSHADLAQDMRAEVHRLLQQGKQDDAVVEHLVARYGNFVRYRPPLQAATLLLWFGPTLLLLMAVAYLIGSTHALDREVTDKPNEL